MKYLQILCYIVIALQTNAQVQIGQVREINSGKQALANVYIKFTDAVPTTSNDSGLFRLAFSGKKAGELIFMEEITKSDYEIVNKKELEVVSISDTDQLPTDIIMAKKGFLAAAKKEYYDVSDAALLVAFEREKTQLRQQLQQSKITQTAFLEQKKALQEQYDAQKIALDAMVEQFARVNFDDADTLYKTAL